MTDEDDDDGAAARTMPRRATAVATHHHLLLLAEDVDVEAIDILITSLVVGARWSTPGSTTVPGVLDLLPHAPGSGNRATLTGPWSAASFRDSLGLPDWVSTAFVLDVEPDRSSAAPEIPGGYGPLLDAFGPRHPVELERQVLDVVYACARRLAGALRVTTGVILEPDPASAVDLTLHSPHWLDPDALAAVLASAMPGLELLPGAELVHQEGHHLDGYGATWHADDRGGAHVLVEVEAAEVMAPAIRNAAWTQGGVISYLLRWIDDDAPSQPSRASVRRRERARAAIEKAALALHSAAGGEILDEDGFLVSPGQLSGAGADSAGS